ncbi:MAG TPA: GNAT family N-acetyltransferase [Candidatus Pseudogracilibacillus intestinigallinarum]|uniref:GNAT family N-acetyltransferase n=1 Tax=Candidatus Pseudogracilibacillus intestinigallinarum TaxID=2838742 RepID=A0A9D1PK28_9BACI|nr:GNAT family N-acetyltransferase [Candidatus Pseudogracilibacillus intestinigallinarum]
MNDFELEYRPLTTMEEMALVKELDRKIWDMDPVPEHQTITAIKNGGIMLGVFHEGTLIGFSYSFPGFEHGKVYLCSHMLGIDPLYQSKGIGEKMKWKQRDIAKEKGYDVMKWTYDPLETKNGKLNLTKLNAICHTYVENCYGNMTDKLNKGLPSDRFEVEWHLNSNYVAEKQQIEVKNATPLNAISWNEANQAVCQPLNDVTETVEMYSLHVPKDFQSLKKHDKELALEWRLKTRHLFQTLFANGYTAVDIEVKEQMSTYYFVKKVQLQIEGV